MMSNLNDKLNWKNVLKNAKTNYHYVHLQHAISEVSAAILREKDEYHSRLSQKRRDPSASSKAC